MSTIASLAVELTADMTALKEGLSNAVNLLSNISDAATNVNAAISRSMDASGVATNRFNKELVAAQAQLDRLNGDSLAVLRAQFNGLVPDSELAKLQAVRAEVSAIGDAERSEAVAKKQRASAASEATRAEAAAQSAAAKEQAAAQAEAARASAAAQKLAAQEVASAQRTVALAVKEIEAEYAKTAASAERAVGKEIASAEAAVKAQQAAAEAANAKSSKAGSASNKAGGKFVGGVAQGIMQGAEALTIVGLATAVFASNFEKHMMDVKHNTTLTDAEFSKFRAAVLALGQETGLPFDKIANGMMRLVNEGNSVEDALKLATVAAKGARAAGADTEAVFNLLGTTMHTFKLPLADAAKAWNVMHVAANEGNVTVEDFTKRAGPAFAAAAALKLPLNDVAAAYSALTRNGFTAAQSNTLIRGILAQIAHPSKQAKEAILDLSQASGVDLVHSMSLANLQTNGMAGVMNDLFKATSGNAGIIVSSLIPSMRGGFGAATLMGTGLEDLNRIAAETKDAFSGKLDPTTKQFNESMKTAAAKTEQLRNKIEAEFLPTGEKFAQLFIKMYPTIEKAANLLQMLLDKFLGLPTPVQNVVLGLGAFGLANSALGNPLNGTFSLLKTGIDWFVKYRTAALAAQVATTGVGGAGAATAAASAAGGGGFLAGAGALLGRAGAAATGLLSGASGIALMGAGLFFGSQESAGAGGDIDNRQGSINDQLIAAAKRMQKDKADLAESQRLRSFHGPIWTRPHPTGWGGVDNTTEEYENQARAQVEFTQKRIKDLQAQLSAQVSPAAAMSSAIAGGAGAPGSAPTAAAGKSQEEIQAAMDAAAKRRDAAEKAHKAALAETKDFTERLKAEQERLNEAQSGGDKTAQAYAASIKGLTAEHRAQLLAVHSQVVAENEAAEARKKQEQVEKRFQTLVAETGNRIDAAHGIEVSGLEKLKAAYPGVEEARLRAELAREAEAKAAENEKATTDKLVNSLANLKSTQLDATAKDGIHKIAIEQTGKAYESLTAKQKALVNEFSDLKKAIDAPKAFDDWKKKVVEATDKVKSLGYAVTTAKDEIAKTQERMGEQGMSLGQVDARMEDRVNNGEVDVEDVQYGRQLQQRMKQRGLDSQTRADLYREFQSLGSGVTDQINDENSRSKLQNEMRSEEDKLNKLRGQLSDNSKELSALQAELKKLPNVNDAVAKSFDTITESLKNLTATMQKTGGNVAGGLAAGLGAGKSQVQRSASDVSQSIIDQINGDLEIKSPSRVMANIGQYIVDGLAVGIKNGTSTVAGAVSGLTKMTVAEALGGVQSTLSAKQTAFQQSVSQDFAARVVAAQRAADAQTGLALGASNPYGVGDPMAQGYYGQLQKDAQRYDSLVVGGKTINRSDSATQMQGGHTTTIGDIHLHINGVTDAASFQLSRGQIMQQMYSELQSYSTRNGG